MLEYSEMPPVSSLYHEAFRISEATHAGQNPSSTEGKLPVQPLNGKDLQKNRNQDGEVSPRSPADPQPGRERPKRGPARFNNPDPILPGLQIKLTEDYRVKVKVIVPRLEGADQGAFPQAQWMGPTA